MADTRKRSLLIKTARVITALLLFGLVWWLADGANAARLLTSANPAYIALALIALTVQTVLCARRWHLTATRLGMQISQVSALGEYYLGQIVNQVVPGGVVGDAARALRAQETAGLMAAGQSVVFERLTGQIALLVLLFAAFLTTLLVPGGLTWPVWAASAFFMIMAGGIGAAMLIWLGKSFLPSKTAAALHRQKGAFAQAVTAPDVRLTQIVLSLLAAVANLAAFSFSAWAVGVDLPFLTLMAIAPVVLMAMIVPFTISGWGVREGAAAAIFPLAGASAADGLATSIIFGLTFLSSALPGVIWLGRPTKPKAMKS